VSSISLQRLYSLANCAKCRVVITITEGLLIFLIAIIWRILSFKYTHLVERLQLLTLIIMGEGIIGMVKSVSCIFKGQSDNNTAEIGTVVAAIITLVSFLISYGIIKLTSASTVLALYAVRTHHRKAHSRHH
jgi:low temperature requirement protein LtrA